jgi:insulysin
LSVGVGSLHDPEEYCGLAHFLEHMLFLGTEKYPDSAEYRDYLTKNGGNSNAYTAELETNYHFEVSHEGLLGALDRFS